MSENEIKAKPIRQVPVRGSMVVQSGELTSVTSNDSPKPKFQMSDEKPVDKAVEIDPSKSPIVTMMTGEQEKFIKFVNEQIAKLEGHRLFEGGEPNFMQLNTALSQHEGVLLGLTSLYETTRYEAKMNKEEYDEWFADTYMTIRARVNPENLPASKWLSQKEIEFMVRSENRIQHAALMTKMSDSDHRLSTLKRLIEGWNNYQFILGTISRNVQSEVNASMRHLESD